jgi:hypothetical protein
MTFQEAKDKVAKKYTTLNLNWDNVWSSYGRQITAEAAELYATAKAAQETETLKREIEDSKENLIIMAKHFEENSYEIAKQCIKLKNEIQAYELTVQNLRNGLAQAWEEGCNAGLVGKEFFSNPYKQEKP